MRLLACSLATLVFLGACAEPMTQPEEVAPPPQLRAEVETLFQGRFPLRPPPPAVHPCFGEAVELSGDYNLVVRRITSAGGPSVFLVQVAAHATGVGLTTGARYVISEGTQFTSHGSGTMSLRFRVQVISQGGIPNAAGWVHLHLTFDANGNLTAERGEIAFDVCRG